MDTQHKEFRIGITVLAALVALVFLTIVFGKGPSMNLGDESSVKVRFQRAPGITRKSPVFKSGVQIGRVSKVELVDHDREVEITIMLPKHRKIYTDEQCRIRQTVIMGDASLEFVKIPTFTGKVEAIGPDSPPLVGAAPSDLMSGFTNIESDLARAINNVSDAAVHFTDVADQVTDFMGRVNTVVGTPEDLKARQIKLETIIDEMRMTMRSIHQLSDGAHKFVNDPKLQDSVRNVIEGMPDVVERSRKLIGESEVFLANLRELMAKTSTSLEKFDRGMDKMDAGMDNINQLTTTVNGLAEQVSKDYPDFYDKLDATMKSLRTIFSDVETLVNGMQQADGTIKRLMRDPELYEKLLTTMDNVEQLTTEFNRMLRTDIKPITNNVKVLTDKAARDPSIFIRNLLRKQPPVKNALPVWGDGLGSDTLGDPVCGLERYRQETVYPGFYYDFGSGEGNIVNGNGTANLVEEEYMHRKSDGTVVPGDFQGSPTLAPEEYYGDPDSIPVLPQKQGRLKFGERLSMALPFPTLFSRQQHKTPPQNVILHEDNFKTESPSEPRLRFPDEDEPLGEHVPLTLTVPNVESLPLKEERNIPAQGRIVLVDPRYDSFDGKPVYRQMSHEEPNDEMPRLNFSKE